MTPVAEVEAGLVHRLADGARTNSRAVQFVPSYAKSKCATQAVPGEPGCDCISAGLAAVGLSGTGSLVSPLPLTEATPVESTWSAPLPTLDSLDFTASACRPEDGCYTLTEGQDMGEVYIPNNGILEQLLPSAAAVEVDPAVVVPEVLLPAAPEIGLDNLAAPEDTASVEDRDFALVVETPVTDSLESPEESILDATAFTQEEIVTFSPEEEMPPVFREGTTDRASEDILSQALGALADDSLPTVELPPELE
jgi:hypothetical protein